MRLVDLEDDRHVYCGESGDYERWSIDPEVPAIDAVEVVRCRNCRHYKESAVAGRKMCFRKDIDGVPVCYDFLPDDWCRYGEE